MASATDLLTALGLPVEAATWIVTANPAGLTNTKYLAQSSIPAPKLPAVLTADPNGTYYSVYTVINAAIKILSAPATDITTGQFGNIIADTQSAITAFVAAATGFPGSALETLQYTAGAIASLLGSSSTFSTLAVPASENVSTFAATPTVATPQLTAALDPSGVLAQLGLPVEAAIWIATANPAGLTNAKYLAQTSIPAPKLPSVLTADPTGTYYSAYTVINAGIKILSAPATDITTGQFGNIIADTQAAITAFGAAAIGFPTSAIATLEYTAGALGSPLSSTSVGLSATSLSTPLAANLDSGSSPKKALDASTTADLVGSGDATAKAKAPKPLSGLPKPGTFVNQLQDAVDNALGANAVKVGSTKTDSPKTGTPFSGLKLHAPTPGSFGLHKLEKKKDDAPKDGAE